MGVLSENSNLGYAQQLFYELRILLPLNKLEMLIYNHERGQLPDAFHGCMAKLTYHIYQTRHCNQLRLSYASTNNIFTSNVKYANAMVWNYVRMFIGSVQLKSPENYYDRFAWESRQNTTMIYIIYMSNYSALYITNRNSFTCLNYRVIIVIFLSFKLILQSYLYAIMYNTQKY